MSKPSVTISKIKFKELKEAFVEERGEEEAVKILDKLCSVLHFDPNVSSYNEENKQKTREYRKKLKDQGISTYISSGAKKYYDKKKKEKELENNYGSGQG